LLLLLVLSAGDCEGGLHAIDNGDAFALDSPLLTSCLVLSWRRTLFCGGWSWFCTLLRSLPSSYSEGARRSSSPLNACSAVFTSPLSSSRLRFPSKLTSSCSIRCFSGKCKSPLLPLEHFIKSSDADSDPGLAGVRFLSNDGVEIFSSFPVSIGACTEATEDKDAREDGTAVFLLEAAAASFAARWCS
jgi:hypothetical protein